MKAIVNLRVLNDADGLRWFVTFCWSTTKGHHVGASSVYQGRGPSSFAELLKATREARKDLG